MHWILVVVMSIPGAAPFIYVAPVPTELACNQLVKESIEVWRSKTGGLDGYSYRCVDLEASPEVTK